MSDADLAAAAGLAITLIPVLMGYLIRGHIRPEQDNPINRSLIALYRPVLDAVDAATTLADLKTRYAAITDYPQRTIQQMQNAVRGKLGT